MKYTLTLYVFFACTVSFVLPNVEYYVGTRMVVIATTLQHAKKNPDWYKNKSIGGDYLIKNIDPDTLKSSHHLRTDNYKTDGDLVHDTHTTVGSKKGESSTLLTKADSQEHTKTLFLISKTEKNEKGVEYIYRIYLILSPRPFTK